MITINSLTLRCLLATLAFYVAMASSGCAVTLYQPLKGLHRPSVVPISEKNFEDMRILVRCLTNEDTPASVASKVCQKIAQSIEEQGAEVEAVTPVSASDLPVIFEGEAPDLTIEIESNVEHQNENKVLSTISGLTLTLVPSVEEQTFVQRIRVFGKDRSVLASDVYRARFVTYVGCALWGINYVLDYFVREERDKITGDGARQEFSRDFYRQVRQLTFNAKIRSEVLGITSPRRRAPSPEVNVEEGTADKALNDTNDQTQPKVEALESIKTEEVEAPAEETRDVPLNVDPAD